LAPEAFSAFDVIGATVDGRAEPRLTAVARSEVAAALEGVAPAAPVPDAIARFAERFVVDVGAITDDERAAATAALGADAFELVQLLWCVDWSTRLDAAFRQCFGCEGMPRAPAPAAPSLWDACEAMFSAVARLRALDPLTTELVRLRGARAHNCRLCKSLRSVRAANDGVDETVYDQIDHYESSALDERHKAALRLTDALIWQPLEFPQGLVRELEHQFTTAQIVELLFDVARNAANKIAVALGADAPHVNDAIEFFDTDERGELRYGLSAVPRGSD
jgi:alkylhydroperoxidase family enzyme